MQAWRSPSVARATARHFEIAPYLREPSTPLRFLAFYFTITGACALLLAVGALLLKSTDSSGVTWSSSLITLYGMNAAGLIWTGAQLRDRSKTAWHCGWFACLAPLLSIASGHGVVTQVMFAGVSLGLLYAVRKEFE